MRFAIICLVCLLAWGPVWSQSPDITDIARRSAFPQLLKAADPTASLLTDVDTTALGCKLIEGLPLATPIDVYRLDFPLETRLSPCTSPPTAGWRSPVTSASPIWARA